VSHYFSDKVWKELEKSGYLNGSGILTEKFTPNDPQFRLKIANLSLPKGLTEADIRGQLKEIYDNHIENQVDLYDLLYEEAWNYLIVNKKHSKEIGESAVEKQEIFQKFLSSFYFRTSQPDLADLEKNILNDLVGILQRPSDQVFISLYYAIHEWFAKEYPGGNPHC